MLLSKRLRVPNETPSTLSEAQVPKPIPRDNGPILIWSKISARSRPSLAIASGIDIPDVYFADSGLIHDHFANGENGRFRTNIQKTLEIEQVFVPSQYIVDAGNHICRTPNALKTS